MAVSPKLASVVALASVLSSLAAAGDVQFHYQRQLVFGASYMDNAHRFPAEYDGRFATGDGYFDGRFCNGPVISERQAADFFPPLISNLSNNAEDGNGSLWRYVNFAFAGAVVDNSFDFRSVPDIQQQLVLFSQFVANGTFPTHVPSLQPEGRQRRRRHSQEAHYHTQRHLSAKRHASDNGTDQDSWPFGELPATFVMLEIGLNTMEDIFASPFNASVPASVAARDANITSQVGKLSQALEYLSGSEEIHAMSPSKTLDVMVFQMFPLEHIPNWSENGVNLTELRREVNLWNSQLTATLRTLNANSTSKDRWLSWDSDAFWSQVEAHPALYGFNDTKDACVDYSTGTPCATPSTYVYWDSVHPTTHFASEIARNILETAYVVS